MSTMTFIVFVVVLVFLVANSIYFMVEDRANARKHAFLGVAIALGWIAFYITVEHYT